MFIPESIRNASVTAVLRSWEDHKFGTSLVDLVRHCLKIKINLGVVDRTSHLSPWEAEQENHGEFKDSLDYTVRA